MVFVVCGRAAFCGGVCRWDKFWSVEKSWCKDAVGEGEGGE